MFSSAKQSVPCAYRGLNFPISANHPPINQAWAFFVSPWGILSAHTCNRFLSSNQFPPNICPPCLSCISKSLCKCCVIWTLKETHGFLFFFFSPFHHNTLSPCRWTWKLAWYVSFKMESTQVKVFVADAQGCIKHTFSSPLRWTGKLHRNEWHTKCMNLMCCVQIWCKQQSNWKKKRKNTRIQIQRASAPTHVHRADYLSNGRETVLQWSLWVVESSVLCFEGFCLSMLLLCSVIRVGFALSTSLGQGHCICIIILPLSGFLNTLCGLLHGANTAMSTRLVCWFASEQVL